MKKILFVITKSNWGGAQRYVFDLATHLPRDRFAVAVALGGTGAAGAQTGGLQQKLHEAGVRTIFVPSFVRYISAGSDIQSFFELYHLFKKESPDVVHLNSSKAGGVGALAARLAGVKKILFTVHGWPFWEPRHRGARGLIYMASWFTALLCHRVIVVSDYDLQVARNMPFVAPKVARIYNGIDLHPPLGSGARIRAVFPSGAKITGTVGDLNTN